MKKLAIILTAALLALVIGAAALANDMAVDLCGKTLDLLFNTENVTLNVTADFSLDDVWFKTVDGTWKQDGDRSYRQLLLRSPKADGTERKNGYTIVTNGDRIYLMEVFTPGVYRNGFSAGRKSILRNTVETSALRSLATALVTEAGLLSGEGMITKTEEGDILLKLDDHAPALVNAALNQFARFAAKRYFGMDYDRIRTDSGMSMYNYGTITEGILYTMQEVSLRKAEITVKTDAEGNLQHAEGTIGLYIATATDGREQLDVSFRADVSGRGTTQVKVFDPADYNVVPADEDEIFGMAVEAEMTGELLPENGALIDEMELKAMEIWPETGFDMLSTTSVGCNLHENCYEVYLDGGDSITKKAYFTLDGRLTTILAEPNDWLTVNAEEYHYDPVPDTKDDQAARELLMSFLEKANPELLKTVKDLKMEWIYEANGAVYAQYHEEPLDQEGDGVLFVVRISPDMRIEYYSCVSNG